MGRFFLGKKVLLICWLVQTKEGKRQQKPGGGGWQQKTMGTLGGGRGKRSRSFLLHDDGFAIP